MKLAQLLRCEKKLADVEIKGITNDSRRVEEGFLFVNTKGNTEYDTHAIQNGAAVVVTSNKLSFENAVFVEDTAQSFANVCANWYGNPAKKLQSRMIHPPL